MEYWYEVNEFDENEEILYSTTVKTYDEAIAIYREWEANGSLVQIVRRDEQFGCPAVMEEIIANF